MLLGVYCTPMHHPLLGAVILSILDLNCYMHFKLYKFHLFSTKGWSSPSAHLVLLVVLSFLVIWKPQSLSTNCIYLPYVLCTNSTQKCYSVTNWFLKLLPACSYAASHPLWDKNTDIISCNIVGYFVRNFESKLQRVTFGNARCLCAAFYWACFCSLKCVATNYCNNKEDSLAGIEQIFFLLNSRCHLNWLQFYH